MSRYLGELDQLQGNRVQEKRRELRELGDIHDRYRSREDGVFPDGCFQEPRLKIQYAAATRIAKILQKTISMTRTITPLYSWVFSFEFRANGTDCEMEPHLPSEIRAAPTGKVSNDPYGSRDTYFFITTSPRNFDFRSSFATSSPHSFMGLCSSRQANITSVR